MTDQIDRERKAFEAWAAGEGFAIALRAEDALHGGEYDTYDASCAWEGWLARAQAESGVSVDKLEALCDDWTREALGLSGVTSSPTRHAMYGCAYDLRAILSRGGK